MQVAGKTVVVTGGANGIGEALCKAFHRSGAEVYTVFATLFLADPWYPSTRAMSPTSAQRLPSYPRRAAESSRLSRPDRYLVAR